MKKATIAQCYLCGADCDPTKDRDHIPPKGLFPQPRPSNLITVPCCHDCNHAFHKQDEKLRLFVSGGFNRNKAGDVIWKSKVIGKTIPSGRQRGMVREMAKSVKIRKFDTPFGPVQKAYVEIPQEEIKGALIRIVKGLLFVHHSHVPRNELDYKVFPLDQMRLNQTIPTLSGPLHCRGERGDGVFRYWGDVIAEAPDAGCWIILFYDGIGFGIMHKAKLRKKWGESE